MRLLAIDTATLTASVAVVDDRGTPAALDIDTACHSERLLPAVIDVLQRANVAIAELDAIAVGAGPGSFTGLRIGLATAKGLAFAAGKPLWLASSLAALAWDLDATAAEGALRVPVLDARRQEIYAGFYRRESHGLVAVAPERVLPPIELANMLATMGSGPIELVGDALHVHAEALANMPARVRYRTDVRATPSAMGVAAASRFGEHIDALARGAPAYIRPSEAEVKFPDGVPGALRPLR